MAKRVLFVGGVSVSDRDIDYEKKIPHSFFRRATDTSLNLDEKRCPDIIGDINKAPLPSNKFDCIYFECIGCGWENDPDSRSIYESHRLLRKKGHLCIQTGYRSRERYKKMIKVSGLFHLIADDGKNKLRYIKVEK